MTANTQKINAKSVLKYALLPGIIPRAKEMATSGFGYLAFLFASVYRAVRILPAHHPYLNPANIGKFGLIQVVGAAANNVQFSKKNLDQIVIFFALLGALAILFLQFAVLILVFFSGQAFAGPGASPSLFTTANPQTDIAFLLLDYVFGIPGSGGASTGFFGSNALTGAPATGTSPAIPAGPSPFHYGLHALFNFYNLAILLVGVLIFMYYVMVVVIETAQTGVPFGRRFSKLYAPIRLVIAIGLLVPLNYGFNGAQYITLYAAKLGSSFATNGWITYTNALTNPTGLPDASLVAKPRVQSIEGLAYFASVYHACAEIYDLAYAQDFQNGRSPGICIEAYLVENGNVHLFAQGTTSSCAANGPPPGGPVGGGGSLFSYGQAKTALGNNTAEIVLGEYNPTKYPSYAGGVRPYCGKISIPMTHSNPPYYSGGGGAPNGTRGIEIIEAGYYNAVQTMLNGGGQFEALGKRAARVNYHGPAPAHDWCYDSNGTLNDAGTCQSQWKPAAGTVGQSIFTHWFSILQLMIDNAYTDFTTNLNLRLTPAMQARGWGGAGIWYNNIADMNGVFTSAVYATPSVKQYPEVLEFVKKERLAQNKSGGQCETFNPNLGDGKPVEFTSTSDAQIAGATNDAFTYFCENPLRDVGVVSNTGSGPTVPGAAPCATAGGASTATGATATGESGNPIIDVISVIFGINGLFDMRTASCWNTATGQPSIHPLAQLSTLGKALVENAIRSMGMAIGAAFGSGIVGILSPSLGAALESASGMFVGIATIGLTVGFLLYYILPFLPFMYFFFAVGSWVKSIFEAMVGAPLWALAHLHIDGDGLSGNAAKGGYFLILEIFLRPIVILFGLIGGMAAFTAMAGILNNIFDLVVFNISGAAPGASTATINGGAVQAVQRGVIDQLFYTVMYAILVYMMATASFKMIDTIPANFMRWIGSGVSTFNDSKDDPTAGLTQYAAIGGSQISGQLLGGLQQGARGLGTFGKGLIESMSGPTDTTPKTGPQ